MTADAGAEPNGDARRVTGGTPDTAEGGDSIGAYLLLFASFAILCLALYRPALGGEFVSDDLDLLVNNPHVNTLSVENLVAIFDVGSAAQGFTANYAPIDELLMALERRFFGDNVLPYHFANVLVHALNSVLLIAWLRSSRLPRAAALLGGLVFAVHPANVEAVAWVTQLKTEAALTFSLAALLALGSAPFAATLFFAAGLLTKASALFALPTAAALTWARRGEPRGGARSGAWLALWAVLFGLYAIPEFTAFRRFGHVEAPAYSDAAVHLWSIVAYGGRYLAMAATSYGLSAFHEPGPALSLLDPWCLAGLSAAALVLWRVAVTLRRRSEELAYWVAAAAAFAPISQIFPFIYPLGDRYLYFILPGAIGGLLFLAGDVRARLASSRAPRAASEAAPRAAIAAVLALAVFFGFRSADRAGVWRDETRLLLDAERHYPEGGPASFLRARRAAQAGDVEAAIQALRDAEARGLVNFMILPNDPALAPIAGMQAFHDFIRGMAGRWIDRSQGWSRMNQAQFHMLAHAHMIRGEIPEADAALENAIAAGGPQEAVLRTELTELRLNAP